MGGSTRAAAVLLGAAVVAGASAVSWAYFSETKTSPQPISVAVFGVDIKYEAVSTPAIADALTFPVAVPPGVQPGWLLVATIGGESDPVVTAPAGWTAAGPPVVYSGRQVSQRSFWHVATASEPASYTFTLSTRRRTSSGMIAYSGVKAANPIEATASAEGKTVLATAPLATASLPTRWIAAVTFHSKDPLTFSADVTERWEKPTASESVAVAEAAMPPGMNPAATVGATGSHEWVMQTIVLNAAP